MMVTAIFKGRHAERGTLMGIEDFDKMEID